MKYRHDAPGPDALTRCVIETLEHRRLLANVTLPFDLDFDAAAGGLGDKDGLGTGFTVVQANTAGDSYQPALIDLKPGAGVLSVTSRGTSAAGGNYGTDNTLANGLQVEFDAASDAFAVTTTIRGPLGGIDAPFEQVGLLVGPGQDNYLKLVVGADSGGQFIQFLDEQNTGSGVFYANGANGLRVPISAAAIDDTLELTIEGDPATGVFEAYYAVDGGTRLKVPGSVTLAGAQRSAFFSSIARAGVLVMHKNDGVPLTGDFMSFGIESLATGSNTSRPSVSALRPASGETGVLRDSFVAADVNLPAGGVDPATLDGNVTLTANGRAVPASVQTTGGGDAIILTPQLTLDADTTYTFTVTDAVRDVTGNAFVPFTSTFTTGNETTVVDLSIAFEQVGQANAAERTWTSITQGPGGRIWGTTQDGFIYRFDVAADGSLVNRRTINKVRLLNNDEVLITGLAFDPASTAGNPIAWVTYGAKGFDNPADFTGGIARLEGALLQDGQILVTGLPRSVKDHMTNQPSFGPDGRLYVPQGSNNAFGAPDSTWGFRPERVLSGAVLAVDTQQLTSSGPVDVTTSDGGGSYDPAAAGAPVTIYATGLRNAYDLVWHSNGNLYAPNNGSAAGGNTPAGGGVAGINNVNQTQPDTLYKVTEGSYFGHPVPARGEFAHSGGNPTAGPDPYELSQYPVGTQPDADYVAPIYSFGLNQSPNGSIEYSGSAFGGRLDEHLLVTQYSGGDDIVAIKFNAFGDVASVKRSIPGLTGFDDPIDLAEDAATGNLYVAEYGGRTITLLRPVEPGGTVSTNNRHFLNEPAGGGVENINYVPVPNIGDKPLVVPAGGFSFAGPDADLFSIDPSIGLPLVIKPTQTGYIPVRFDPASGDSGIKTADLAFRTSDPNAPVESVELRGLVTTGEGGDDEPSLQELFGLYEFGLDSGDADPATPGFEPGSTAGDAIDVDYFRAAKKSQPVSLIPLSVFAPDTNIPAQYGIYAPGSPDTAVIKTSIVEGDNQSAFPRAEGNAKFSIEPLTFGGDILGVSFGVFTEFNAFLDDGSARRVYSEPSLNTWEPIASERRKMKAYPFKGLDGTVVPDVYLLGFEEFDTTFPSDFQDAVALIRNVRPVTHDGPEVGLDNPDRAPFSNRLTFSKIDPAGVDTSIPNEFADSRSIRVNNTGTSTLTISDLAVTGPFTFTGASTRSIPAGGSELITVGFTADGGTVHEGALTFTTNDADEPDVKVELGGVWQSGSEQGGTAFNLEPTLQQIIEAFGYTTAITFAGEDIDNGGLLEQVGEEILSSQWQAADPTQDVRVTQLAAYHGQGDADVLRYQDADGGPSIDLFQNDPNWSQSVLPDKSGGGLATATFSNGGEPFLLRVDNEWSDHTRNFQEQPGGNYGHHMRFFPARDREGRTIPDTYLMTMDFASPTFANYDFNDNVYVFENIIPADRPASPKNVSAYTTGSGVFIGWAQPSDERVLGFLVYRSDRFDGRYTRLNDLGFTDTFFFDENAPAGRSFYQVLAYGANGQAAATSSITIKV